MLHLKFQPFPVLQTGRLLLRQMTMDDAPEIFVLRSHSAVLKFLAKEPATTIKEAEDFITRINDDIAANEVIMWGIALQEDPAQLLGTICYWRIQKEHYRAEIGYLLHPDHWRKGIMKEAIGEVITYGFRVMQLHSIEGRLNADNLASAAILEATGFTREAYFKEDFFFGDRFLDTIVYSLVEYDR
jgi:[ribosomal protein S5]-alanine N-acetyltransferase